MIAKRCKIGNNIVIDAEDEEQLETSSHSDDDSLGSPKQDSGSEPGQNSGSEKDSSGEESDSEKPIGNAGWADAISKVLRTSKPKKKKTLVLSRAKKLTDVTTEQQDTDPDFEITGEIKQETPATPTITQNERLLEKELKRKKKVWENMCRLKPNILERERERALAKIATKGVVQLFNAVRQQQKSIEAGMKAAGGSERRQEQVLRSVDKNSFLDILMGPTRSTVVGRGTTTKVEETEVEIKKEDASEESNNAPLWSVLRDDFLVGGRLKDWDRDPKEGTAVRESSNEESSEEEEFSDNNVDMDSD